MKKYTLLFLAACFTMCSSPKIKYREYEYGKTDKIIEDKFLKEGNAQDSVSSVLFFTELFIDSKIKIKNDDKIIFDGVVNSDRVLGLGHVLKIDNRSDCIINDLSSNKTFKIKSSKSTRYKYIYIGKDYVTNKYTITYSNTLRGFM